MSPQAPLQIDITEEFPHFPRAAITEAVIEIRARASVQWNEAETLAKLKPQLTDYPENRSARGFLNQFQFVLEQEPKVAAQDLGWQGYIFTSTDKKQIAKFQLELFSFSRLQPYQSWKQFKSEAMRLWEMHYELARPAEIQRLGVRFINRFPVSEDRVLIEEYLKGFPDDLPDLNLTLTGFLHHNTLAVPNHPYAINLIKTVQNPEAKELALILDVDVYTQQPFEAKIGLLEHRLAEIRWLKNKTFLGTITEKLKERLQ